MHRECVSKCANCPLCRNVAGFVAPRAYNDLMQNKISKKARCNYCGLIIKNKEYPQSHLSKCENYKNHLLKIAFQQRQLMFKAFEEKVAQDPIELDPKQHAKDLLTIKIPDIRKRDRNVHICLLLEPKPLPFTYILYVTPETKENLPLQLSLVIADSLHIQPHCISLPNENTCINFELTIKSDSVARFWVIAL